jgi:hypothetical protein
MTRRLSASTIDARVWRSRSPSGRQDTGFQSTLGLPRLKCLRLQTRAQSRDRQDYGTGRVELVCTLPMHLALSAFHLPRSQARAHRIPPSQTPSGVVSGSIARHSLAYRQPAPLCSTVTPWALTVMARVAFSFCNREGEAGNPVSYPFYHSPVSLGCVSTSPPTTECNRRSQGRPRDR